MGRFDQRSTAANTCWKCGGIGLLHVSPNCDLFKITHEGLNAGRMAMTVCTECQGRGAMSQEKEMINHPQHYNEGKYEVIDVIEDWKLSFNLGNTVKYIARHEHKANPVEDLVKAWWYLSREILAIHRYSLAKLAGKLPTIVRYETARDIEVDEETQLP